MDFSQINKLYGFYLNELKNNILSFWLPRCVAKDIIWPIFSESQPLTVCSIIIITELCIFSQNFHMAGNIGEFIRIINGFCQNRRP